MRHVHLDITDSTNLQARRIASQDGGECVLVTAAEQTAGRGRLGRQWKSPRGGAWLSLAWPMKKAPSTYATASLVAAIAVVRALGEIVPECDNLLQIKWPNDVLLKGRKVACILCEQALAASPGCSGTLIVGVGVNVDFDLAVLPDGLRHPATTLRQEVNCPVSVNDVSNAVAARLVQLLTDFETEGLTEPLVQELQSRLAYIGMERSFELAACVTRGIVTGIDQVGRLMIQCADGSMAFASGELLSQDDTA